MEAGGRGAALEASAASTASIPPPSSQRKSPAAMSQETDSELGHAAEAEAERADAAPETPASDATRPSSAADGEEPGDKTEASLPAGPTGKGVKRRRRPTIDIDDCIYQAREQLKKAKKIVAAAKAEARNERRRKQRVVKKAASLSLEDLERIAVLKRCGLQTDAPDEVLGQSKAASTKGAHALRPVSEAASSSGNGAPTDRAAET